MLTTIIRTTVMYVFVTLAVRLMGKRQIGDLQPNELVITLLISEIAAIPLQDINQPVLNGVVAIFVLVILEIIASVAALKSFWVRRMMSGQSVVIIKNGRIDRDAMKRVRITTLDLIELLRQNGIFSVGDVAFAVLEVNGNLSVLKKSSKDTPTLEDMDIRRPEAMLSLPVICDGKLVRESLGALQFSEERLQKILSSKNRQINEVFLMTLDRNGNYEIIGRRDNR